MVKNCDRGLENAARGLRPRATFRSQFFAIRTTQPANNIYIFSIVKKTDGENFPPVEKMKKGEEFSELKAKIESFKAVKRNNNMTGKSESVCVNVTSSNS